MNVRTTDSLNKTGTGTATCATSEGVLPDTALRHAIVEGWIRGGEYAFLPRQIQPASVDLRLGPKAYRLQSSFLPGHRRVEEVLDDFRLGPAIDIRDGAVLEKDRPYLIPLIETIHLPSNIRAKANPKSSVGRLDIFTRVLADRSPSFDDIPLGYSGPLFLEVISRSFTVRIQERLSLNQVRLMTGEPRLTDDGIREAHERIPLLYDAQRGNVTPVPCRDLVVNGGLFLTVELVGGRNKLVGFRARKNSMLLDLSEEYSHELWDFWEPVLADRKGRLILEPEEFYLLVSRECVSIPPEFAAQMSAYDPTSGELRTHYAGFFDPGFGFAPEDGIYGSRAMMEVRAHDVPFALTHGQKIARLEIERTVSPPAILYGNPALGSSYQNQHLMPSKHFKTGAPLHHEQLAFDLMRSAPPEPSHSSRKPRR